MAITRAKKEEILKKLETVKNSSEAIVFVGFKGLPVNETRAMRDKLRASGVSYFVAKKTLIAKAFAGAFQGEAPTLEGEVAVAYSTDAVAPAREVKGFADNFKDNLSILGGVFQGQYKNQAEMSEIASIPSLKVLRGMFVNVINSPIQGLVISLNQIAEKRS